MPLIRCPKCAQRQVVEDQVIGSTVGCSRCERTYVAEYLSARGHFQEWSFVAGAVFVGAIVSWMLLLRPH